MSARAEHATPRALARLYCPPAQAPVLDALLGIEGEIRAALKPGLEHEVAHARLRFWREECARLAEGAPVHPLTRALGAHFPQSASTSLAGVGALADLASWDLAQATFGTRRELSGYCERWSAALIVPLAAAALPAVPAEIPRFGAALKELELLLALARDARAGRIRIPLEELEAAGVAPAELAGATAGAALAPLIGEAPARVRRSLTAATFTPQSQPALRALLVWAGLSVLASRRAQAALPALAAPSDHPHPLDGFRAWRIARRADRGGLGSDARP